MTWRPTTLNLSLATLLGWALLLGVLGGRAELIVAAVPLVVALAAGRRPRPAAADWQVARHVSRDRLVEGERVTVTVTLRASGRREVVELYQPLPPHVRLAEGRHHAFVVAGEHREVRWSFELSCAGRQRLRLGDLHLRRWEPLGLAAAESVDHAISDVSVYPHVTPLRRPPSPARTQTYVGHHVSPAQGEGIEPGDIRPFVPGDQVRHVNWRATLRLGALHVTQHHRERNADVVLLLDTLADVGPPGDSAVDRAVRGAASLAAAYLARKDRVGLIEYGGILRQVRPAAGRAHWERLLDTLARASVVFTYVARDLERIPPRVLPPQALVIALSPLLDGRFLGAATDLAARGFDLLLVAVSPIAAARALAGGGAVTDLAARLWALERRAELDQLRARGLTIIDWDGVEPLEAALAVWQRPRQRRVRA
ncbi:MAG TPA: DUF58 domain-containing protein [Verrucomicrobiae bacterium]|nr:DUF58 domain-containing protein [Verrucomicrobiae bacterium]